MAPSTVTRSSTTPPIKARLTVSALQRQQLVDRLGSNGALQAEPVAGASGSKVLPLKGCSEDLNGVLVLNNSDKAIGFI
jgi:hypothetical protein